MRANASSPEDDRVGPPVEYVFDLASQTYALEHTVVEAFDGQIHKDVDFAAFIVPIERALDHHMPSPGSYRLTFAIHPSQGLKPKRIAEAQAEHQDLEIDPIIFNPGGNNARYSAMASEMLASGIKSAAPCATVRVTRAGALPRSHTARAGSRECRRLSRRPIAER